MITPTFPHLVQIKDRVRSLFYSYGLFCATHQLSTMVFAILSVLFVIYPLKNIQFIGNALQTYKSPVEGYTVPKAQFVDTSAPLWYNGPPIGYVQQILIKSTIAPWQHRNNIKVVDSFRTPLLKMFDIIKFINEYQYVNGSQQLSLADVCLRVSEPNPFIANKGFLPQYDCLVLSPANLWKNQKELYLSDEEIVKTVFSSGKSSYDGSPRIRELLFGVPWLETGMSKYFIRNRQRTIQYAVTIFYKSYNKDFIKALNSKLIQMHPLSYVNANSTRVITHVSYTENSSSSYLVEYTPLIAVYLILFLYIYFSVQKIEMVKSKWGLALSAVVTVVASLLMSISICSVFGVTPSVNGGEIFPYLVVVIGLENVLVLTRSVVSTPLNLEVKFRIAEGLRREGWNITKHLMTEQAILILGFLTFVPAIQEFCLFASIGLLVDFYLQMVFFATILSIDIRRLELSDLDRHTYLHVQSHTSTVMADHSTHETDGQTIPNSMPSREGFIVSSLFHIPKRIKLMNFVAQFRIVQRLIMLCTVIWIGVVLYKTGIIHGIVSSSTFTSEATKKAYFKFDVNSSSIPSNVRAILNNAEIQSSVASILFQDSTAEENWSRLPVMHWPGVFSLYNKSLIGSYISFLPLVKISMLISPDEIPRSSSRDVVDAHTDYLEGADRAEPSLSLFDKIFKGTPIPTLSTSEKILFGMGSLIAFVLLVWLLSVLYSVMCRKDYAKWRKSAGRNSLANRLAKYAEILQDETNFYMDGLTQPVECLSCSPALIVCSDLVGDIRSWNTATGELVSAIERSQMSVKNVNMEDDLKMQYQQGTGTYNNQHDRSKCKQSVASADVMNFDLAPFVETEFHKMEKRSFSECLQRIEEERLQQSLLMSSISSHKDICSTNRDVPRELSQFSLSSYASSSEFSSPDDVTPAELAVYDEDAFSSPPNIWCLDVKDGLIVAGCSDGSIEFWDSCNGFLKYQHRSMRSGGVASIRCISNRVIAGRTDGYLDFIEICYVPKVSCTHSANSTNPVSQVKGHRRIRSLGKNTLTWRDMDIQCNTLNSIKAHQSTIGLLDVACGRCLTACEDKIINVYRYDDANLLYTLRGHKESIILLQADEQTATAQSASDDGMIRLWDLLTGACIHKLTGLIGPVLTLQISANYIVGSSLESLICVWDKSNGRMLHSIHRTNSSYTGAIAILADSLLISGGRDTLYFWDLESGELVYSIQLPITNTLEGVSRLSIINDSTLVVAVGCHLHTIVFPRIGGRKV